MFPWDRTYNRQVNLSACYVRSAMGCVKGDAACAIRSYAIAYFKEQGKKDGVNYGLDMA